MSSSTFPRRPSTANVLAMLRERWRGSTVRSVLTPDGAPLELAFRSESEDVAYTAEPGAPDAPAAEKWQFVRELVPELAHDPLLRQLAAQPGQRFGCWLGIREHGGRAVFKVYQEVTAPFAPRVAASSDFTPTLFAVAESGATEVYGVVRNSGPATLHRLYAAAGAARQLPAAITTLSALAAAEPAKLWPRLRLGISYKVAPSAAATVTLFVHTCQLVRNDRDAAARILSLGRPLPAYERLSRSFTADTMRHGMIAIGDRIGVAVSSV